MSDSASSLPRTIARQYDLFQASLEFLQKDRKFLNYGYTVSGKETYEERQQRLCLEVFQAAEIGQGDVVIDVGFGSGEQDFLLSTTCEFSRLIGFNISERQVRYARMKMGFYSQLVALGLRVNFIQYDLIVLEKR